MSRFRIADLKREGGIATRRSDAPDDLFLVCASYEPRTTAVAEAFAATYRSKKGIIYCNREFLEGPARPVVKPNIDKLTDLLRDKCEEVHLVDGGWLDAKEQFTAVRDALKSATFNAPEASITVDITTFNREALLVAMALIRSLFPQAHIRILYVSPEEHGEWLSRGFRCVRNIMGFPGTQQPSLPTLLVVLSGFEPHRVVKLVDEHEPTIIYMGIGDPPTKPRFLQRNVEEQKVILARQDVKQFAFSAENVAGCRDCLEKLLAPRIADHNVILAPMSTKLSSVAALLVAERHCEVQLTYCVPGEYNIESYSRGAETLFVEELNEESDS